MVGRCHWGMDLPLAPFFGVMGVRRRRIGAAFTSLVPRQWAAISTQELTPAPNLSSGVRAGGAVLCARHGVKGEGEVCVTPPSRPRCRAFQNGRCARSALAYPRAKPAPRQTMAMDPISDQLRGAGLRDMIVLLGGKAASCRAKKPTRFGSLTRSARHPTVNGSKGLG